MFILLLSALVVPFVQPVEQFVLPKVSGSNILIEKFRDFAQYLWAVP
jgi:hypothetical protein